MNVNLFKTPQNYWNKPFERPFNLRRMDLGL